MLASKQIYYLSKLRLDLLAIPKYFEWSGWKAKAIHNEIRKLKSTHMGLLWWPWSCFLFDCAAESACKGPQRSKPFLLGSIKSWPNWSSNGLLLLADGLHPIAAQIDERLWTSKYTAALCKAMDLMLRSFQEQQVKLGRVLFCLNFWLSSMCSLLLSIWIESRNLFYIHCGFFQLNVYDLTLFDSETEIKPLLRFFCKYANFWVPPLNFNISYYSTLNACIGYSYYMKILLIPKRSYVFMQWF